MALALLIYLQLKHVKAVIFVRHSPNYSTDFYIKCRYIYTINFDELFKL
jgi:hypothetical protein